MVDPRLLKRITILRGLPPNRMAQVAKAVVHDVRKKGDVFFRQGEPARSMWILLDGWVHLVRGEGASDHRQGGRDGVVIFTVTPAEVLIGVSTIEPGTYAVSGIAATTCTTIRMPGELFSALLREEPGFAYVVLRVLAARFRKVAEQYGGMAEPVRQRILRAILRLHEQFGATIPMTHRELAQMSWTTTESAIRVVRRLKQEELVEGRRGELLVRDPEKLLELVRNGRHGS